MKFDNYKNIIALDLSLTEPGYAFWQEGKELQSGIINVGKTKGWERLNLIRQEVETLLDNLDLNTLAILEGYSFNSKGNSAVSLGELGGIIRLLLWDSKIPFINTPPTQLKKFLTGKGSVGKELIIRDIYRYYDIVIDNNNQADAVTLAMIGKAILGNPIKKLNKDQEKIVESLKKEVICRNS